MKTIVVYRSVLGTTKQYAKWLGEELFADVINFKNTDDNMLDDYNMVVVMSGTYAGKMPLVNFLIKHWKVLQHKKVIVVAVGIAPAEVEASKASYNLIPSEIRKKIHYFKIPGNMFGLKPAGKPSVERLDPVLEYIHGL